MEAYIVEWLHLLARWAHFITGIAWIGSSFYFIWLDNHLEAPQLASDGDKGVGGELWSVHGGGFYHSQKYRVAPSVLPETLHWFKWEAYTTWLTGMFLLILVYWYSAQVYLIDPTIAELTPLAAVGLAIAFIVGGWVIYDLLCKTKLGDDARTFAIVLFVLVAVRRPWRLHSFRRGAWNNYGRECVLRDHSGTEAHGRGRGTRRGARPARWCQGKATLGTQHLLHAARVVRHDEQPLRNDLQP